jgi:murein DD-endopeptidase MepM/ murein hydrolase activator NlpD
MCRRLSLSLACSLCFLARAHAQEVFVPRQLKALPAEPLPAKNQPAEVAVAKPGPIKALPPATPSVEPVVLNDARPAPLQPKAPILKTQSMTMGTLKEQPARLQPVGNSLETAFTKLADGFDFPVGKPEAQGYYRARGFHSNGHLGEDWDGVGGGDTDFNDPIYCIGDGIVVFARDVHLGWGNVVIVRHAFRENGTVKHIDSLYGHLNRMLVSRGQQVARGQQIATMGTAHGQYDAHLHLEIRKNIEIGLSRAKFARDLSNYYDPSQFIGSHRHLSGGGSKFRVAMNTFTQDSAFHFDSARDFGAHARSTAESAAALKHALSATAR